jgi:hypothetical protein
MELYCSKFLNALTLFLIGVQLINNIFLNLLDKMTELSEADNSPVLENIQKEIEKSQVLEETYQEITDKGFFLLFVCKYFCLLESLLSAILIIILLNVVISF